MRLRHWCTLALPILLFVGCQHSIERSVTIRVFSTSTPPNSRIFATGNIDQLGNWNPGAIPLDQRADSVWEKTFRIKEGTDVEFKITRGSWRTGERDLRGFQYGFNHTFRVSNDTLITMPVSRWADLAGGTTSLRLSDITLNNGFWIVNGWRYKPGDDSVWISPSFDDRSWELGDSRMNPDNQPAEGWHGIGWFRLHLDIDSSLWNYPLAFRLWQTGASEVYLDGKLIYAFGVVGRTGDTEQSFEDRSPKVISFARKADHVLAVRYSNFSPERFWRVGIYAGFEMLLGDLNSTIDSRVATVRRTSVLQMVFTTIPLVLALIHFFLFVFYPKLRENLYYALCMVGFAGITFSINQMSFTTSAYQVLMLDVVGIVSQMIAVVSGLLMFYTLAFDRIPLRGTVAVGMGVALSLWAILLPDKAMNAGKDIFTVLVLLEILIGSYRSGRHPLEGASIVGIGFLILAVTVAYEMLAGYGIIPTIANIRGTYVYGVLALSISMSIFLSRRFAYTNRQLEVQLQQVRELSERALDQERRARDAEIERRVLAADNERKTKELEDARQFQLSLLPKEIPKFPGLEIAAFSAPATEVGGDYYDFATMVDGALTVVLGDATGHGAKAGTMVAVTKGLFHELAHLPGVVDILARSNKAIKGMNLGSVYMGMTVVRIRGGDMETAATGMPPILVYRASTHEVEQVTLKGMPLGAFSDFPFEHRSLQLSARDTVVLMSDGYPERFNQAGETLDLTAVIDLLRKAGTKSPQEIIDLFLKNGEEWANGGPQNDDMTFVVIKKL
jgi:serine phosphatase RsbU (regulator of sigma subunit)